MLMPLLMPITLTTTWIVIKTADMKSYKVLISVVIVLVLINCILLVTIWCKQQKLPGREGPPQAANEYLSKELKLTAAQETAYAVMRKQHFEFSRKLNDESHLLHDSIFENIKTPVLNTAAVDVLEKKISTIQLMLDTATLNHFRRFRATLSTGQQEKFDRIIKNAMHMMGGPPQRGRRPGPPDGMRPQHRRGDRPGPPDGMPPPGGPPGQGLPPPNGGPPPN